MKKGVIFDQDGLLFDTEQLYTKSWKEAGRRMNVPVPEEFTHAISGSSGQGMIDIIHHYIPMVDAVAYRDLCYQLCQEEQRRFLPEKPGLHEILAYMRENGVKMAVASSSPRPQVERNLKTAGVSQYFDVVVTGEDVTNGKPAPEIFLLAAEKLGLAPEDCYVFEDSFNGVRAGHAAGCCTVMVPDRVPPTEKIKALCDYCCASLLEFVERSKAGEIQ